MYQAANLSFLVGIQFFLILANNFMIFILHLCIQCTGEIHIRDKK